MSTNSSATADNQFGPTIKGFRGNFDFTLLFEDAFLALIPSAILLAVAPFRAIWLYGSSKKVSESSTRLSKVAFLAGFAVLELTLLLLWATSDAWDTPLSIPASAIDFAAACGLCVLSILEHSRTVRPSVLINLYLALSLPFDVARTRTLWMIKEFHHMAIVQTVSLVLKSVVLVLEATGKRGVLLAQYQDLSPEATSGIYSRSVFWWLTPIFGVGFKKNLELADLDTLDPSLQSENLFKLFTETYGRTNKNRKHALFFAAFAAMKRAVAVAAIPRVLLIAAKFAQPFLLNRTTTYVANDDPDSVGWGLVGAYALVYVSLAILTASYTHLQNRCITMLRGGLISMIYAKTVDLSVTSVDESSSMTLMSSDIERITTSLQFMHDTWAAVFEIGIAIFILERSLGVACIAPAVITFLVTAATAWVTKYSVTAQKTWVESIQTRIDFTSRMLASMRSIKLLGLSDIVANITQRLREVEVSKAQRFRLFFSFRVLMANLPSALSPVAAFAIFVISAAITGNTLSTAQAFTALSVIQLVEDPLGMLLQSYTAIISSLACYTRIQDYLESPSRYDHRLRMTGDIRSSLSSGSMPESAAHGDIELQRLNEASKIVSEDCLVVQDASFGWPSQRDPVLRDINLRIRSGSFTFIIGPVGAGKSTLLKGMLGETHSGKGFVYTNSVAIAFADQDPWVQNGTIRENILGLSLHEPEWYNSVVHCCGLQDDLEAMPDGDETRVGSNGIHLSGGQKQRLALARAVYCRRNILMLDDVFSGIDGDTEEHIFTLLFGPKGVLRKLGTTVVLVTHAVHRLSYSDHVAVIKDGAMTEQGTFEFLQTAGGYVHNLATKTKSIKTDRPISVEKKLIQKPRNQTLTAAAEELARRTGDWSVYKYYAQASGISAISLFILSCTIFVVALKSPELLVKYWAEAVGKHGNSVNGLYMGIYSGLVTVAITTLFLSLWIYMLIIIPRTSSNLHASLLGTVMRAPLSFFTRTDSGSLTSRFSQDLAVVDYELPLSAIQTTFSIGLCVITFVLMLLSAGEFAATMPFLAFTLWAISKVYLRTSRQMRLLDLEAKAPLFSLFRETLTGLATIRAFGWAEEFRGLNQTFLDDSQKPFYLLFCIQRWLSVVLDLVVAGLAVVLMVLVVVLHHKLNPGFVALALLSIMSFNQLLAGLIKSYTSLETSIGAISRIRSFVTTTEQETKPEENIEPEVSWPSRGNIEISKLKAAYSSTSRAVLSDVNLNIEAGEKIGICGRSGSGKSSLLSSLLHILEYQDGSIMLDGVDISLISRNILRQRCKQLHLPYLFGELLNLPKEDHTEPSMQKDTFSYTWSGLLIIGGNLLHPVPTMLRQLLTGFPLVNVIPQEPYFIKGTFRFNIDPWSESSTLEINKDLSDKDMVRALEKVGIWNIIEAKGGLDAQMESDSLSQGQKQLFCLARALLRKSKVLILDEVTSSVDVATDALMQRIIRSEFVGCTIIAVAHRLNTIVDFDKIAVLATGRVLEFDAPENLLGRSSAFRELYET